jgi:hypothetical protein
MSENKKENSGIKAKKTSGAGEYRVSDDVRLGYIQGVSFRSKPVQFAVVNKMAIFEGDIVLGNADDMTNRAEKTGLLPKASILKGIGITGMRYRWPNYTLPYEIDSTLTDKARVTDAISHWHASTRIRFVQRTAQNASQYPNYVKFIPDASGCWSMVGMQGSGQQGVGLASGCSKGNAIHEIGHTVGLWHEQSREDRDTFVTINWANIDSTKKYNFNQQISDGDDYGPYEYGSIMHYGAYAFSINDKPTIVPKTAGATIGQRDALSAGDVSAIYIMYWHRDGQFAADAPLVFQNHYPGNYNYELVVREGDHLRHYWYVYGGNFNKGLSFGSSVLGNPVMFQNYAAGNYNYELVVREGDHLQHYWFGYGDWKWHKGLSFGSNIKNDPVLFQNRAPNNNNYELIVQEGDHLQHYWFEWGNWTWKKGESFGSGIQGRPAVFQNHYPGNYNYEVVAREGTHLQHYWFGYGGNGKWSKGLQFGSGIAGDPLMFQNHALGNYNYELIVQEADHLQHYWFGYGNWKWTKGTSFASGVKGMPAYFQNDADSNRNYELIVREGDHLQHYWFGYGNWKWTKGTSFGSNIAGNPSVFQNHAPANNNYELFVKEGTHFQHYWFSYGNSSTWNKGQQFG